VKAPIYWLPVAFVLAGGPDTAVRADDPPPLQLRAPRLEGEELVLAWEGGRGPYRIQFRAALIDSWQSIGIATTNTNATVTLGEGPAFYRVIGDYEARYRVTFDATWSSATHPGAWPPGAHWSTLVGAVHNDRVSFWRAGAPASPGIENMAERGATSTLATEIQPALQSGDALVLLIDQSGGLSSPGSKSLLYQAGRYDFPVDLDHPMITLVSMVAPSPDWFVGVHDLSLLENGRWTDTKEIQLFAYDAGTDDGADFTSADIEAQPHGVISIIEGYPARIGDALVPFGTFTFTRVP